MTGSSSTPPGDLFKKTDVHFTLAERFPLASICTFDLTLPLNLASYQRLQDVMTESLISWQAFEVV